MARKVVLNLDGDLLNSDWLKSRRILMDKKKSKKVKERELEERESEKLVPFEELEEK